MGNIVIAVTSFVADLNCTGVDYGARIDTADALGFIKSFLSGGNFTTLSSPSPVVSAGNIDDLRQIVGSHSNAFRILQADPTPPLIWLSKATGSTHGFFLSSPTAQATVVDFPGARQTGIGIINDSGTIAG